MRLIYSGKTKEFTPELEEKITGKLAKLSKLLEQRGEREAHVTHCMERHLHKVELIVNFYDHALVAEGIDADLEIALCDAAEKLEGKALKARNRWRDTHRDSKSVRSSKENWDQGPVNGEPQTETTSPNGARNGAGARKAKVFRVNYDEGRKPMTLEEALLEIEKDDYVVYRDADRNCLSVLLRRSDGNYDLIES
jgi:putative sigma-54 modulation protein